MAIRLKTREEIEILRECGKRLAAILAEVAHEARAGVSAADLDSLAERLIHDAGGEPAFKGYTLPDAPPFPATICVSRNDEVVHGIPTQTVVFREGDIIGIDIGMAWAPSRGLRPLITDTAITVPIGAVSPPAARLVRATEEALAIGIREATPGKRVGDVSAAIERSLKGAGLGIVRGLAGHGVGFQLHEDPYIPNYGTPGSGAVLKPGMVFAIEPMATLGSGDVVLGSDGWTFHTSDGSLAAHAEHTVALTERGAEILTVV